MRSKRFYQIGEGIGVSEFAIASVLYFTMIDVEGCVPLYSITSRVGTEKLKRMFKIDYVGDGFDIEIKTNILYGYNLETVSSNIQKSISEILYQTMGVKCINIDVIVEGIESN